MKVKVERKISKKECEIMASVFMVLPCTAWYGGNTAFISCDVKNMEKCDNENRYTLYGDGSTGIVFSPSDIDEFWGDTENAFIKFNDGTSLRLFKKGGNKNV